MGADDEASTIDQAALRAVMGHFATGVTVITAMHDGTPLGIAANSFTSVSLDPPLVLFCAGKSSSTWPGIKASGAFAVNILAEEQEPVSRLFSSKDADRFAGVGHRVAATGSPILDGALAFLDCRIESEHDAGDHVIVVGRVVELSVQRDGPPLVFFRGGYHCLGRG